MLGKGLGLKKPNFPEKARIEGTCSLGPANPGGGTVGV